MQHSITEIMLDGEGQLQIEFCLPRVGMQVRNIFEEATFSVVDVSLINKMMTSRKTPVPP